jgi:hypothetical protein
VAKASRNTRAAARPELPPDTITGGPYRPRRGPLVNDLVCPPMQSEPRAGGRPLGGVRPTAAQGSGGGAHRLQIMVTYPGAGVLRMCAGPPAHLAQRICMPEIAREMTRRWISEVPSKIV